MVYKVQIKSKESNGWVDVVVTGRRNEKGKLPDKKRIQAKKEALIQKKWLKNRFPKSQVRIVEGFS